MNMLNTIRWAVRNAPAMNLMTFGLILMGTFCILTMRKEVFPEFELEIILVSVPYPGASPDEVEEGICQKVEEACQSIAGVKKMTSIARESGGFLVIELESSVKDVQKILNEVRSEIDQIPSFPELAEDPDVKQITFRAPAIAVGITGPPIDSPDAEKQLREIAESVRNELLQQPPYYGDNFVLNALTTIFPAKETGGISTANIASAKQMEIDVEISEETLRKHGLTLRQVADVIRKENLEIPAGSIKTPNQEMVVRGKNKYSEGHEIAKIKVISMPNGDIMTVGDLGSVQDGFEDRVRINEINGKPGLVISIEKTTEEDLMTVVGTVKNYIKNKKMPQGYELTYWADQSIDVQDRIDLLVENGSQGLLVVFFVLALFLEFRLAFWVAVGIPVSIVGSALILVAFGQTLNMLTLFSFLLTLGIVVDDAIVISENVFAKRQQGMSLLRAAIEGTAEVIPSVFSSVFTTVIAFVPLFFVTGIMGKFIAVMPLTVIAMLVISLLEATFVLPSHLAHENNLFMRILGFVLWPFSFVMHGMNWLNKRASWLMQATVDRFYGPLVDWCLSSKPIVIATLLGLVVLTAGLVAGGFIPFVFFPKLDSRSIEGAISFPDGTSPMQADMVTLRLREAIYELDEAEKKRSGKGFIDTVQRTVGSMSGSQSLGANGVTEGGHVGTVKVALVDAALRELTSEEIIRMWREKVGTVVGADMLRYASESMGPGGKAIEFKLLAKKAHYDQLQAAVEECKQTLNGMASVFDVEDDSRPGKAELQVKIKEEGKSLGVSLDELTRTLRASFYGEEVQRLQKGRNEVKLMVRYPESERKSLENLKEIRIRTSDGIERPITELADITIGQGESEIQRIDQMRAITVLADVDVVSGNAETARTAFQKKFNDEIRKKYPDVFIRWEGEKQQQMESMTSMMVGFAVAMVVMYIWLALEFGSYLQPLLIMVIIPFGFVGALFGHLVVGISFGFFSMFGLIALSGVVVNDSIVLLDFINTKRREGMGIRESIVESGKQRFRAVWLTSLTTMGGLLPMIFETSFQAQVLIPMAVSLCFGILFSTVLVLIMMPILYEMYANWIGFFSKFHSLDEETPAHIDSHGHIEPPRGTPNLSATGGQN